MGFDCPTCGTHIEGMNCTHELSRCMDWTNVDGCVSMCECGYPVRAKEARSKIFSDFIDNDTESTEDAYIYCQKGNQGHVYYGTYSNCVQGNGVTAEDMEADLFERYASADP